MLGYWEAGIEDDCYVAVSLIALGTDNEHQALRSNGNRGLLHLSRVRVLVSEQPPLILSELLQTTHPGVDGDRGREHRNKSPDSFQ